MKWVLGGLLFLKWQSKFETVLNGVNHLTLLGGAGRRYLGTKRSIVVSFMLAMLLVTTSRLGEKCLRLASTYFTDMCISCCTVQHAAYKSSVHRCAIIE